MVVWGRYESGVLSLDLLEDDSVDPALCGAYVACGPNKRYWHVRMVSDPDVLAGSADLTHEVTRSRLLGIERVSQRLAVNPAALDALRSEGEVRLSYRFGEVHLRLRHLEYVQSDLFEDVGVAA